MSVSYKTKVLLAFRSGDICALPDCNKTLSVESSEGDPINVGEAAHIEGEHGGNENRAASARYNPDMTDEERNSYYNLIYLCARCHKKVDAIPQGEKEYPTAKLQEIKKKHEEKVREGMLKAFADVGFPELEEATEWVRKVSPSMEPSDFDRIELEDKIRKNELEQDHRTVIASALGIASEVQSYIQVVAQTDPEFPERLKAGFLEEYFRLRRQGIRGGELFELMCSFSQQGFKRQAKKSAGLAVLIHLFEKCEVFEK